MWDRKRNLYIDGIVDSKPITAVSEQANVLCALTGIVPTEETANILRFLEHLNTTGTSTPLGDTAANSDVRIATPYFAFYLLSLLYREGKSQAALDYMRQRWRRMLDAGATTFWEQWEPHWSLCHAWSAAPTYFLMAYVAGIRPTQPGFEEFNIHLEPLTLTWLRCTVPTPRGDIELSYHNRQTRPLTDPMGNSIPTVAATPAITVNLTVPNGARSHVRLPLGAISEPTITLNGKTIWENGKAIAPSGDKFIREEDYVAFAIIGGRYHVEIGF